MIPITREAWEQVKKHFVYAYLTPAPEALGLRVVDGVVVPKEPTLIMVLAGAGAQILADTCQSNAKHTYLAMLSAAQKEQT